MRVIQFVAGVSAGIAVLAVEQQALCQENAASPEQPAAADTPKVAPAAIGMLEEMGAYIGSADQFTFRADISFDHVLPSGQKLQFSAAENVALQRPSRLYVEWSGDLGERQFWYDGKSATIYDPDTPFYSAEAAPPEIDGMLEKLVTQLNFSPPLSDFLYSDPYKSARASIQYGFSLGVTEINGRSCRALAFVEKEVDWQIWIDTGPQRVPCKVVITYKNNPAQPQFSATFTDWDFEPRIASSTFTPELPVGTQAVPFEKATTTTNSN
jgi:hypothetical protein